MQKSKYAKKQIRKLGRLAFQSGHSFANNPFTSGSEDHKLWEEGFKRAYEEFRERKYDL